MPAGYIYEDSSVGWRLINSGDIPSGSGSPLTTKGDVYGFSTVNARIPVGANNTVLTADSTQTLGVKWAATGGGTISDLTSTGSTITVSAPTGPTTNVDLPTTGVGAGTYGDSTHVAEVTVDAEGRVTAASSVAISGSGGAGGLVTLYDSGYLGSDAASIDTGAGGIAAGHGNLMVWTYLRTADAVANQNMIGLVNNDSGANYNEQRIQASNAAPTNTNAVAQSAFLYGNCPGANATANSFGTGHMEIAAYDQTTNWKTGITYTGTIDSVVNDMVQSWVAWQWKSTAAISRLSIKSQAGGNIKAGSRMMVLGTQ